MPGADDTHFFGDGGMSSKKDPLSAEAFELPPDENELEEMRQEVRRQVEEKANPTITPDDFRKMAKFCNDMVSAMMTTFVNFQEQFKNAALAFTQLADLLDKNAQKEEAKSNVFDAEKPNDPGPIVPHN